MEKRSAVGGALQLKVQYKYDALGNRIERTLDSDGNGSVDVTERFGYDNKHVWADLDGSNALTARRLFGILIDSPVARVSSGTVVWYLTDYQNNVTQIVNGVGTLGSITYDGFGNIVTDTTGGNGDRYKYTGREWDASTQLQYNRARYYDPTLGRWTSIDPIGFAAGDANLYRYLVNSSTNGIDPFGLELWELYDARMTKHGWHRENLPEGGEDLFFGTVHNEGLFGLGILPFNKKIQWYTLVPHWVVIDELHCLAATKCVFEFSTELSQTKTARVGLSINFNQPISFTIPLSSERATVNRQGKKETITVDAPPDREVMIAILQRAYNVYVYGGKEVVFTAYAEKFYKVKYTRKVLLPKVDPKPL